MHTIVLATQKGGSGKSTLAIGLALAAKQAGFTVRLIETDPQGTLSNWQRRRTAEDLVVEPIYHAADIAPRLNMLADSGLHATQYTALQLLDSAPNLSTTELAEALGIDQTTATRTLALIKKAGLASDTIGLDRRQPLAPRP